MGIEQIIYYCLACFIVVIVPGPTVTLIIANALSFGTKAGVLNVAGTQLGLILMIGLLAVAFQIVTQQLQWFLIIVRYLGAVYLVWLGYKIFTSRSLVQKTMSKKHSNSKFVLQGFVVIWSNPKAFLFLGAFIPQFLDLNQINGFKIIYLGLLFMLIGSIFDSAYAIVFGKFRTLVSTNYLHLLNRIGGCLLALLGVWLAITF
jgi:threonine/homoserine/homoserine lactone efflux protein|tara:strand:- start:45 stop:653 length:609 start_codon:yes stop_codon:yes gene_type:complete